MPLEDAHAGDIGMETADGTVCIHDMKEGGIRPPEEIFEGGVQFFLSAVTNGDRDVAERLTRKNMNLLPYWQIRPFTQLQGAQATDEEFAAAMTKL